MKYGIEVPLPPQAKIGRRLHVVTVISSTDTYRMFLLATIIVWLAISPLCVSCIENIVMYV